MSDALSLSGANTDPNADDFEQQSALEKFISQAYNGICGVLYVFCLKFENRASRSTAASLLHEHTRHCLFDFEHLKG